MKNKLLYIYIGVLLISAFAIISCSKNSGYNSTMNTMPGANTANTVSIVNMSFSPASLTVTAGTTVVWTNNDMITHTVTADDGSFDSGNITMGAKYSRLFSTAGTYAYHCTIHPDMKGTIVVK